MTAKLTKYINTWNDGNGDAPLSLINVHDESVTCYHKALGLDTSLHMNRPNPKWSQIVSI